MIEQDTIRLMRKYDDGKDPNLIAKGIAVISVFVEKEKVDKLLVEACQLILSLVDTLDAAPSYRTATTFASRPQS